MSKPQQYCCGYFIYMRKGSNALFLCAFWIYFLFALRAAGCYNRKTMIRSL